MAEFQLSKTEKLFGVLTLVNTAIAISMVVFQYKRHAEYLYLKSKSDEAGVKAEAAIKTVSHFDGQIKSYFNKQQAVKTAQRQ